MNGDAAILWLGRTLPILAALTCLVIFAASFGQGAFAATFALWMHHAGIALLFAFLMAGQYLQVEAWWKSRRLVPSRSIAETYRRLWALAELVPAPTAAIVLLTGLRLIWEAPGANSPSNLWLLLIIAGFAVFFFDGLLGYLPLVRRCHLHWAGDATKPAETRNKLTRSESVQLFAHFVSFPVIVALGVYRWNPANPVSRQVRRLENALTDLHTGWPQVLVALIIFVVVGGVVASARLVVRHISRRRPV